jgi:hypothetical protein
LLHKAADLNGHFWNDHNKETGVRIGLLNVRPYMSGLWKTVVSELAKHELYLVGVQVKWDQSGTTTADSCTFFCKTEKEIEKGVGFFIHEGIVTKG